MEWVVDHLVLATDAPPISILLVIAILAQDVGSRIFEITIDQMIWQAVLVVGCEVHGSRGPGLGLSDGAGGLVGRDLAGRVGCVLVVGQFVRFGEHHVVDAIAFGVGEHAVAVLATS